MLEAAAVTNRFVLLGLMVFAILGLLWLAFKNFCQTAAANGRIMSAIGMAALIIVFLASALLSAALT